MKSFCCRIGMFNARAPPRAAIVRVGWSKEAVRWVLPYNAFWYRRRSAMGEILNCAL